MSQPALTVPAEVVGGLVDAFLATGKGACSSFRPEEMRARLTALAHGTERVDFHAASRVLSEFECPKLTALCNSWTPWMRQQLNDAKRKEAPCSD